MADAIDTFVQQPLSSSICPFSEAINDATQAKALNRLMKELDTGSTDKASFFEEDVYHMFEVKE
ncbi:MAG: hypothetical protein NC489_30895 [Ruminococcus flavefaciens]|nr:hypothetical protein [Ruminococcus flavefaciens]